MFQGALMCQGMSGGPSGPCWCPWSCPWSLVHTGCQGSLPCCKLCAVHQLCVSHPHLGAQQPATASALQWGPKSFYLAVFPPLGSRPCLLGATWAKRPRIPLLSESTWRLVQHLAWGGDGGLFSLGPISTWGPLLPCGPLSPPIQESFT